jgi:mitosis inhibitor protein kinase SWE1
VKRPTGATVAFPSVNPPRPRHGSTSSVSSADIPSPVSLFRAQAGAGPRSRTQSQSVTRRPIQRHTSNSSASLFFGPSIPGPEVKSPTRSIMRQNHSTHRTQAKMGNRHTYSGNDIRTGWEATPSKSPPFNALPNHSEEDTDIDDFFSGPSDSSFAFTVIDSTPLRPRNPITFLPKKYKPRDSAVLFESDDDRISSMPGASSSLSTINSGDGLVTPVYPSQASGWPFRDGPLVAGLDNDLFGRDPDAYSRSEADAFIMRLLAGNANNAHGKGDSAKRMPDTPVKKVKTAHFAVERPWQSAFTRKTGSEEFDYLAPPPGRGGGKKTGPGKKPRKSLPAAFPTVDADSPTDRKDTKYAGLGLGRPRENAKNATSAAGRTHWLMRRSSSGAFSNMSSGSDNSATATPTRPKDKGAQASFDPRLGLFPDLGLWSFVDEWHLPPPRIPNLSASKPGRLSSDQRSTSSSSNSTIASPTSPRFIKSGRRPPGPSPLKQRTCVWYAQPVVSGDECPGKFERDFDILDEDLGSGEFGRVLKVRRKDPTNMKDDDEYAIKKSKPIEGLKHRCVSLHNHRYGT